MTRVKICGITRPEDAQAAVDAGAHAVGVVFAPGTRRAVTPARARTVLAGLPPFVARVGLFVDAPESVIRDAIEEAGLDTVQLHGDESPDLAAALRPRVRVVKAFRVRDAATLASTAAFRDSADAWLLDAFVEGVAGGTGARFDWSLAAEVRRLDRPVIVAGGLKPDTVGLAIAQFRPFAVDVSSGVESEPGLKDAAKLRAFLRAVAEADRT